MKCPIQMQEAVKAEFRKDAPRICPANLEVVMRKDDSVISEQLKRVVENVFRDHLRY